MIVAQMTYKSHLMDFILWLMMSYEGWMTNMDKSSG